MEPPSSVDNIMGNTTEGPEEDSMIRIITDHPEIQLLCSKKTLCEASPVFKEKLETDRFDEKIEQTLDLKGKDLDDVFQMLRYLRGNNSQNCRVARDARRMLPLAEEYRLTELKTLCEKDLVEKSPCSLEMVVLAQTYKLKNLLLHSIAGCAMGVKCGQLRTDAMRGQVEQKHLLCIYQLQGEILESMGWSVYTGCTDKNATIKKAKALLATSSTSKASTN